MDDELESTPDAFDQWYADEHGTGIEFDDDVDEVIEDNYDE